MRPCLNFSRNRSSLWNREVDIYFCTSISRLIWSLELICSSEKLSHEASKSGGLCQEMLRSRESTFIFPCRRERVAPLCAILSRTPPLCSFPRQSPPQLTQGVEVHKIQGLQKLEGKNRKTFGRQLYLKLVHYRLPVKEAI